MTPNDTAPSALREALALFLWQLPWITPAPAPAPVRRTSHTHALVNGVLVDVSGTGLRGPAAIPILKEASEAVQEAKGIREPVYWMVLSPGSTDFQAFVAGGLIRGTTRSWSDLNDLYYARRNAKLARTPSAFAPLPISLTK